MWMRKEALATSMKMKKGRKKSEILVAFQSQKGKRETFLLGPQREPSLRALFSSSGPPEAEDDKSDCSELHSLLLLATAAVLLERTSYRKNMGIGLLYAHTLCSGI